MADLAASWWRISRAERLAAFASFPRNGLYVALFNTALAGLLTGIGFGGAFLGNFVFAQCIGLLAWLVADGSRRMLWPGRLPPPGPMLVLMLVTVAFAWPAGTWLASALIDRPVHTNAQTTSLLITIASAFAFGVYLRQRERAA